MCVSDRPLSSPARMMMSKRMLCAEASACFVGAAEDIPVHLDHGVPGRSLAPVRSGCFVAGFGEGEPLVAEVGDDLQATAKGFDVGGQRAQFGGAWLGVLDGGHAALGDAEAAAHLGEPESALLGAQLVHPGGDGGPVGRVGIELGEELIPVVVVELAAAHRMSSCFR